jgi:hypothetical protein
MSTDAVVGRGLLDDLVDAPHLGAGADHLAEGALVAQVPPQHLDLSASCAAARLPLSSRNAQSLGSTGLVR